MQREPVALGLVAVTTALSAMLVAAPVVAVDLSGIVEVPPGIRLVAGRATGGGPRGGRGGGSGALVFADAEARPLYASAGVECTGGCLERWQPALAPSTARTLGPWSPATTSSGTRQWAYDGRRAYVAVSQTAAPAVEPGGGRGAAGRGGGLRGGPGTSPPPVQPASQASDGMTLLTAAPGGTMRFPHGISALEYRMAPGLVLAIGVGVATPMGRPLYAFVGTPAEESKLARTFRPQYASALDLEVGDFAVRERPDGSRQWTFRGAPLYTCDCDIEAGDVNGRGTAGIVPALLLRYPMPADITLRRHPIAGGYLAEAATGQTLYFRDRVVDGFEPDNMRPLNGTVNQTLGALLGTRHCDAQCEREWRPLIARQGALPMGFWSLHHRADGRNQWAYKDTPVYTHVGEPPGTLYGNETYRIRYNDGFAGSPQPTSVEFGMGLLWRALVP